jgi:thiamine-monophosphate kinase
MNRNLSDCAAMACLPAAALVTVALPRGTPMDYAKQLYQGIHEGAQKFDCVIIGGDTASWPGKLAVSVSILGRSAGITPVTRAGAKPGEGIFVTGPLGGSLLGRHMTFEPQINAARMLAGAGLVTAMVDLSDGVSRDLMHICRASNVGAVMYASAIPIHEDAVEMRRDGHSPLEHALHDGEDYELLFTSARQVSSNRATLIGQTTPEPGVWLEQDGVRTLLEPKGWEHQF